MGSAARRWWWIPFILLTAFVGQAVIYTNLVAADLDVPSDFELSDALGRRLPPVIGWIFAQIQIALIAAAMTGLLVGYLWQAFRRRSQTNEFERYRLATEAEFDLLRRETDALADANGRAEALQEEVTTARTRITFLNKERKNEAVLTRQRVEGLAIQISTLKAALDTRDQELQDQVDETAEVNAKLEIVTSNLAEARHELKETRAQAAQLRQQLKESSNQDYGDSSTSLLFIEMETLDHHGPKDSTNGALAVSKSQLDCSPFDHCDDLTLIRGIGDATQLTLKELGIESWEQILRLDELDEPRPETLAAMQIRCQTEGWADQASELIERFPLSEPYNRPTKATIDDFQAPELDKAR